MKSRWFVIASCCLAACTAASAGRAQQVPQAQQGLAGSSISAGGSQSGTGSGLGQLHGNERFLRGNRQRGEFVGSDLRNRRHFIGSQQGRAAGYVRPATSGTRFSTAGSAGFNARAGSSRRASELYSPSLEIAFDVAPPAARELSSDLTRRLKATPGIHPASRIEVWVEGRTAILRGEIASERDRMLAEQIVLFEPGISAVQNDLERKRPSAGPDGWRPSPPPYAPDGPRAAPR